MTDVWELAAYVEAHPDNHEQRWRLAKKLYTTWEYRLALEHLLLLKNDVEPREHVMRYIAATYYRLGRHDESIKALQEALTVWPKNAKMIEQLARTQTEAEQHDAALKNWKVLRTLEPTHPFAAQAIARLQKLVDYQAQEKAKALQTTSSAAPGGAESANGAAPPKEVNCPKCGEKNTPEFRHCWKCNAPLTRGRDILDEEITKPERIVPARLPYPMGVGILIAALFALAVYCTMRGFAQVRESGLGDTLPLSVDDFMTRSLLWTRILLGGALLVIWPFAWRLAAYLVNVETRIFDESLYQSGALLALTAYALLWTPWAWLPAAAVVPVLLSALIAFSALKLKLSDAAKLWAWQLGSAVLVAALVIVARHGSGLLIDIPKIVSFAQKTGTRPVYEGNLNTPGQVRVQWNSSGSHWLDRAAGSIQFILEPGPHERLIFLETIQGDAPLTFSPVRGDSHTARVDHIQIGVPYRFDVRSDDRVEAKFKLYSLLPFTVEVESAAAPPKASP